MDAGDGDVALYSALYKRFAMVPGADTQDDQLEVWLYLGIADGMPIARVWTCRYSR